MVWKLHSILKTVWPKPSVPEMSGASVFIGTNAFKAVGDGVRRIQDALHELEDSHFKQELLDFWAAFNGLLARIHQSAELHNERVDEGVNLLYLASGIFYHRISEIFSLTATHDERLVGVEQIDELSRLCNWTNPGQTVKVAFDSVSQQMAHVTNAL